MDAPQQQVQCTRTLYCNALTAHEHTLYPAIQCHNVCFAYLDDLLVLIILSEEDLVHNRGLPLGPLVGHGGGLVHVVRQHPARPHGKQVLGVGGADLVDVVVTILNGLTHSTQPIGVQQLVLAGPTFLQHT